MCVNDTGTIVIVLTVYSLDLIKLFILIMRVKLYLITFLCTCYYLSKADNLILFLWIKKVLLYCIVLLDHTHRELTTLHVLDQYTRRNHRPPWVRPIHRERSPLSMG